MLIAVKLGLKPKFDSKPLFFCYFKMANIGKTTTYVNFSPEKV